MSESGLYSDDSESNTEDFPDDEEDDSSYDYTGEDDSDIDNDLSEEFSDSETHPCLGGEEVYHGGHYYCEESQYTTKGRGESYLKKFVIVFTLSTIAVIMACYYVMEIH